MTRAETLEIQRQLGLKQDGIYGPKTHDAYQRWLNANTVESMPTPAPAAAKPWWASRAVLGLLATALALVAGQMGFEVDDAQLTGVLLQAVELGGLALATWGTVRRKAPVDPTLVARLGTRDIRLPLPAYRPSPPSDPRGSFSDY